jgi:hypothetical protein
MVPVVSHDTALVSWMIRLPYGGHPLYLFDGPSGPFKPAGEDFLGTVAPMPPWRVLL